MKVNTSPSERLFALDVLRGIAILLVLIRHLPSTDQRILGSWTDATLFSIKDVGWSGVDLFFVLSGFLISGLLFKEFDRDERINVPRFLIRRGLKIWPSYLAVYGGALLVNGVANVVVGKSALFKTDLVLSTPNLLFVQNYFPAATRWPHSWSLAIEEHFYLALPIIMTLYISLCKRSLPTRSGTRILRGLVLPLIGFCVAVLILRLLALTSTSTWEDFYYPTHFRADSLGFGVILGYMQHYHAPRVQRVSRYWPALVMFSICMVVIASRLPLESHPFTYTVGFTLLYLGYGALVMLAGIFPNAGNRSGLMGLIPRALAWVGVYSYTIYLTHSVVYNLPFVTRYRKLLGALQYPWTDRVLFLLLSILAGVIVSYSIERPFLRARAVWFPSKEPMHTTATAG